MTVTVGDTLNFTYSQKEEAGITHDVWDMKTEKKYTECDFAAPAVMLGNSPTFQYKTTTPGTFYYACSAQGFHCIALQKVIITVKAAGAGGGGPSLPPCPNIQANNDPFSTVTPCKPTNGCIINVGGDNGWTAQTYAPIEANVGDILNFTGVTKDGKFGVFSMGTKDNFDSCTFNSPDVKGFGRRPWIQLNQVGTLFFSSLAQNGELCKQGQLKLVVNVVDKTKAPGPVLGGGNGPSPSVAPSPAPANPDVAGSPVWEDFSNSGGGGGGDGPTLPPQMKVVAGTKDPSLGWVIDTYNPITASVGDSLNFTWDEKKSKAHDVWVLPNEAAFEACDFSKGTEQEETSDAYTPDVKTVIVKLDKVGTMYFACHEGKGAHCKGGQKVKVNVVKAGLASALTPTSSTPPAPKGDGAQHSPAFSICLLLVSALVLLVVDPHWRD